LLWLVQNAVSSNIIGNGAAGNGFMQRDKLLLGQQICSFNHSQMLLQAAETTRKVNFSNRKTLTAVHVVESSCLMYP
jgi:hypothetical protein